MQLFIELLKQRSPVIFPTVINDDRRKIEMHFVSGIYKIIDGGDPDAIGK